MAEDVAITRAGPKAPVAAAPDRAPGSVRRTSSIDSARPDGPEGDVQVVARARDLRTGADGSAEVLAEEGFEAAVAADRALQRIDHPDARLAALVGIPVAGGFRARAAAAVPEEAERLSLLDLLLDDLPGAILVAGYAMQRHPSWNQRRIPVEHLAGAADQCAGWAVEATILRTVDDTGIVPTPTAAPIVVDADGDPLAWHARPALEPGSMRRARRLDLTHLDGDRLAFDVHFRDSYVDRDGVEGALHEYSVVGYIDAESHTVLDVAADAHVLPWVECPAAIGSAPRVVGVATDDLRMLVRTDFRGTSTCTHLNDTLRSLADLPALARSL
jgi:hypothetical protein